MKVHVVYPKFGKFNKWEKTFLPTVKEWLQKGGNVSYSWEDSPEKADIIALLESSTMKSRGHADDLLREPCLEAYPGKVFTINYEDGPAGFLRGVYVALSRKKFDAKRHRSGPYLFPYREEWVHRYYPLRNDSPELLFSFRGYRSHPVRARIFEKFPAKASAAYRVTDTNRWYVHSDEDRHTYFSEILKSKFVLCPRGCSTTSYHLYEAMELGRCPVIMADAWVPLERVPWERCSIFIPEKNVRHIEAILKEREKDWRGLGDEARIVWERYFSPVNRLWYILDEIQDLYSSSGEIPDVEHCRRLWKSRTFLEKNGWTLRQRIVSRIKDMVRTFLEKLGIHIRTYKDQ